ncbi:MAG: hypothetical protein B6D61_08280 [Bacteroidetes bacterium 4484_249]|nr:MAG: hypothetical protein B6D61_08280 [Bacteroidetes bacterium 4484_249]
MNPFTTKYNSKYFFNRQNELQALRANLENGLNTLLHSPRRLGKTALIYHLFHNFEKSKEFETIYVDLFASSGMADLIRVLSEKILEKYHRRNFLQGISKILKGINASVTITPDGIPQLDLHISETQHESTLNKLLNYLESRKKTVVIAFDEFQEVLKYKEKAEAILRTHIQPLSNVFFIFSGSSSHLLQEMFFNAKHPFYQSAEVVVLDKINRKEYFNFIQNTFIQHSKSIEPEAINFILNFTECYTYYTQVICNQAYYNTDSVFSLSDAQQLAQNYLENKKQDYLSLLNLLPENQKKIAIAVAKEDIVSQPTSIDFIMKYRLPSVSSVLQAIKTITDKEILYKNSEGYTVYDVFFKRFLQKYF